MRCVTDVRGACIKPSADRGGHASAGPRSPSDKLLVSLMSILKEEEGIA
jgi:hypothetical protein